MKWYIKTFLIVFLASSILVKAGEENNNDSGKDIPKTWSQFLAQKENQEGTPGSKEVLSLWWAEFAKTGGVFSETDYKNIETFLKELPHRTISYENLYRGFEGLTKKTADQVAELGVRYLFNKAGLDPKAKFEERKAFFEQKKSFLDSLIHLLDKTEPEADKVILRGQIMRLKDELLYSDLGSSCDDTAVCRKLQMMMQLARTPSSNTHPIVGSKKQNLDTTKETQDNAKKRLDEYLEKIKLFQELDLIGPKSNILNDFDDNQHRLDYATLFAMESKKNILLRDLLINPMKAALDELTSTPEEKYRPMDTDNPWTEGMEAIYKFDTEFSNRIKMRYVNITREEVDHKKDIVEQTVDFFKDLSTVERVAPGISGKTAAWIIGGVVFSAAAATGSLVLRAIWDALLLKGR